MRILYRTLGCLVVGVGGAIGIFGLIALQTDLPYEQRMAWYGAGIVGLVVSFVLFRWMRQREERDDARRSKRIDQADGSRVRTYRGRRDKR